MILAKPYVSTSILGSEWEFSEQWDFQKSCSDIGMFQL